MDSSKARLALLAAALLWSRGSWGASLGQEKALARAEDLVSRAEACSQGKAAGPLPPGGLFAELTLPSAAERAAVECRSAVSTEWLLSEPDFLTGNAGSEALGDVKAYYMCRAAAAKDPSACGPLKAIPAKPGALSGNFRTSRESCEKFSRRFLTSKAIITGDPSAGRLCRTMNLGEVPFTPEDQGPLCDLLLSAEKDQDAACDKAKKIYNRYFTKRPPDTEPCEVEMRSYWGLEDLECGKLKTDPKAFAAPEKVRTDNRAEEFCVFAHANAAFRRAYKGKDPGLCGADSPLCRAMLGARPSVCAAYAEQAKAKFCARLVAGSLPAHAAAAAVGLLKRGRETAAGVPAGDACSRLPAEAKAELDRIGALLASDENEGRRARFSALKARLSSLRHD